MKPRLYNNNKHFFMPMLSKICYQNFVKKFGSNQLTLHQIILPVSPLLHLVLAPCSQMHRLPSLLSNPSYHPYTKCFNICLNRHPHHPHGRRHPGTCHITQTCSAIKWCIHQGRLPGQHLQPPPRLKNENVPFIAGPTVCISTPATDA